MYNRNNLFDLLVVVFADSTCRGRRLTITPTKMTEAQLKFDAATGVLIGQKHQKLQCLSESAHFPSKEVLLNGLPRRRYLQKSQILASCKCSDLTDVPVIVDSTETKL